jgi:hypothetical protein
MLLVAASTAAAAAAAAAVFSNVLVAAECRPMAVCGCLQCCLAVKLPKKY